MKNPMRMLASLSLLALIALPGFADSASGVTWQDLSKYEQRVLVDLKDQWDALPPARQIQLQEAAELWLNRSIQRRKFDVERFENWQQMSDDERKRLRKRFQKFQSLPDSEREKIRAARQRFEQLDPEERERWRKRWETMTPEERAEHQAQRAERRAQHRRAQHRGKADHEDGHLYPREAGSQRLRADS